MTSLPCGSAPGGSELAKRGNQTLERLHMLLHLVPLLQVIRYLKCIADLGNGAYRILKTNRLLHLFLRCAEEDTSLRVSKSTWQGMKMVRGRSRTLVEHLVTIEGDASDVLISRHPGVPPLILIGERFSFVIQRPSSLVVSL